MRRAISTCTSPEVFFGQSVEAQAAHAQAYAQATNDPLGLAMDTLQLSSPVMQPANFGSYPSDAQHGKSQ